jgi:glycosyltransferase involved in cell wall biosynthesis
VTIGVPVYNGASTLPTVLECVLGQTFGNIELLISDNCSTDATPDICHEYVRADQRVTYHRTERNLGAARNYTCAAQLASGTFFKWLSHDDWIAPDFVEACLPLARSSEDVITVAPIVDVVDDDGSWLQSIGSYVGKKEWSSDRLTQYRQMMDELAYCETHSDGFTMVAYQYGFHRLELLRRTRLMMPFISADYVLAAELALFGQLVALDAPLSRFTLGGGTSSNFATWNPAAIQRMLDPDHTRRRDLLVSVRRRHWEHVRAVLRSPLPATHRVQALEAATRPARARATARLRRT